MRFEQGLGVAPWVHTDRDTKTLDDAFALHWNGNRKPWDLDRCDEETRPYFLRYLARSPGLYGGHVAESGGDYLCGNQFQAPHAIDAILSIT